MLPLSETATVLAVAGLFLAAFVLRAGSVFLKAFADIVALVPVKAFVPFTEEGEITLLKH